MALFFRCDNGIVNILFYPTSKIFPFADSTFTLQQSFFWLIFRLGIRNGFNEKKYLGFYQQFLNGINVDGRQIWEIEHFHVPKKSNWRLK